MTQEAMPNPVELYQKATSGVSKMISGIKQDQISAQTPCSEWKVNDLINHLIGGAGHLKASLAGSSGQANPGGGSSPSVESDIAKLGASYKALVAEVLQEASKPSTLEAKVPTPAGEMSGDQFIGILFLDNLVHTWDLAKATGQDTNLDPALTEVCYNMFVPGLVDMGREHGAFGPVVQVPASASTQDKMLGYMGRQP